MRNSWLLDSDLSTLPLPPLLHHLRLSITTALPAGCPTSEASTQAALPALLASTVALETKAAPYAALLTTLYFTRCAKEDQADAPVHLARRDLAELLACALVARYRTDWPALVDVLIFDFSPRQGLPRLRRHRRTNQAIDRVRREEGGNGRGHGGSISISVPPPPGAGGRGGGPMRHPQRAPLLQNHHRDEEEEEDEEDEEEDEDRMSALEVAILARARRFLSHPSVWSVVVGAWRGDISFYASMIDSAPSHLPLRALTVMNLRRRGATPVGDMFRVSRLRIPRYQHALHFLLYLVFLRAYTRVSLQRPVGLGWEEGVLGLYVVGYVVESLTQLYQSGWRYWRRHLLSWLDVLGIISLFVFLALRIRSLLPIAETGPSSPHHSPKTHLADQAFDVLALSAVAVYPRALTLLSRFECIGMRVSILKRIVFRSMNLLVALPVLGVGFLEAFYALAGGRYGRGETAWLLARTTLGGVDLGFARAGSYHAVYGPWLMLVYVTFMTAGALMVAAAVVADALGEGKGRSRERYRYEFALRVLEHVKSESLWPLPPPFNLLHGPLMFLERGMGPGRYARLNRGLLRVLFGWALIGIWVWEAMEGAWGGQGPGVVVRPDDEVVIPPTAEDRVRREMRGMRDRMDKLEGGIERVLQLLEER